MNDQRVEVPAFRLQFSEAEMAAIMRDVERILRSGRLTLGPYTERFEAAFADLVGTKHAVAVNSGTSALEIVFRALDVRGAGVLVPTNTNFATAVAAIDAGASVRLYDAGLSATAREIEPRLDSDTKAVVLVHIGGYISDDVAAIRDLCARRKLLLIEDAAHAHGAFHGSHRAGALGHAAAFSFVHTKVLTTGEGGMITTNDADLARLARSYRNQGYGPDGKVHRLWGNSWRLTEIGAAIGLAQLPALEDDCAWRVEVMRRYRDALHEVPALTFPSIHDRHRPSGYKCIALARSRADKEGLTQRLREEGIQLARGVYDLPLHEHPVFEQLTAGHEERFPLADRFAREHLCLPLWRSIPRDSVERAIGRIRHVARSL